MKSNIDLSLLEHMLEDVNDIESFIKEIDYDGFLQNALVRKAVCMSLINIGELVKQLSDEIKSKASDIPWRNIAGIRDITAHKYHTLNLDVVWAVATNGIIPLKELIIQELNAAKRM